MTSVALLLVPSLGLALSECKQWLEMFFSSVLSNSLYPGVALHCIISKNLSHCAAFTNCFRALSRRRGNRNNNPTGGTIYRIRAHYVCMHVYIYIAPSVYLFRVPSNCLCSILNSSVGLVEIVS